MAGDVDAMQDKTSKACCAVLEKKHLKLLGKYSKLEEVKNKFRNCTAIVQEKYDVIEKENGSLKKELEEIKVQVNIWKDEKEAECGRCVDLDDEVSALKEEIQMLKLNHEKSSQDPDEEIQERLNASEKLVKHLKGLLDNERRRAAMEIKKGESEKKKSVEALKEVEAEKKKASEAEKVANVERKKAEENRILWEKFETEACALKSILASERSKTEAADKKVEDEVLALKEEIQLLKLNLDKSCQDPDKEILERLDLSEKEFKHLKELLDQERQRAAMEVNNAESEKKKSVEAFKKLEAEKKNVSEAEKVANVERKKAEENRILCEKLKTETDALKAMLASERSKIEAADKKVKDEVSALKEEIKLLKLNHDESSQERLNASTKEINHLKELLDKERQSVAMEKMNAESERKKLVESFKKVREAEKVANVERKKAEENRLLWEKFKTEIDALKAMLASERSKIEAADKKVKDEVSALKEEIQLLKLNHDKSSQESLNASTKEINHLKELLDKERQSTSIEKLNAESERNKSVESLKKVSEAEKVANVERKKAEENRLLWEKLKTDSDALKAMLASERSKIEAADKKVKDEVYALKEEIQLLKLNHDKSSQESLNASTKEINHLKELLDKERQSTSMEKLNAASERNKSVESLKKVSEAEKVANVERKKAEENRLLGEKLKTDSDALKAMLASERSKIEAADKKMEDDVSALKEENQLLKQNHEKSSQERLNWSEKKINHLKELLDKERQSAAMEKMNAESERKKSVESLKKVSEAEKVSYVERKKVEENMLLWGKLKSETDALKAMLASERSKAEASDKKVEAEKLNAITERKRADLAEVKSKETFELAEMYLKKAMLENGRADDLNRKLEEARIKAEKLEELNKHSLESMLALERSKSEAAYKKMEAEKLKAITTDAKSKEKFDLAEMNLKKAMFEKFRADDLNRQLEETRIKAEKLEEFNKRLLSEKSVWAQADKTGKSADLSSDASVRMLKKDAQYSKRMLEILFQKEHIINREKKRARSAKKKAKKQKKAAEAQEKLAKEQKHRGDQLFKELQSYKLRLKEIQKELQELVSQRIYSENAPLRYNEVIPDADTVRLLKKRLKLEKMLVKHASETAKVETLRNNMLHRELFRIKQESRLFQQRLKFLDKSFLHGLDGTNQLEKIDNQTSTRETFCSDKDHKTLVSGIDYGLDTLYRGPNQKLLQSSAINSSSASFSDRTLVGSQERRTSSVTTSDKLGEDISNLKPTIPRLIGKRRMRYNEHHTVAKADNNCTRGPGKDNENHKRVGYSGKKRNLDAVEPIENLNSKARRMHQCGLEKLSFLPKDVLEENSGREFVPEDDAMIFGGNQCLPQDFDERDAYYYMKLLNLDDDADEISYRKAIAKPLSPLLPEVKIHEDANLEVDNPEMLALKSYPEASFNVRDNLTTVSSFCTIDMEKNPTSLVCKGPVSSHVQPTEDSVDLLKCMGTILGSDTLLNQSHVSGGKLGMPDVSCSGNKETDLVCDRGLASSNGCLLRYFVVPSDYNENASILRILQTMDSCKPQYSFLHSTKIFLRSILNALSKDIDLSMKEKACALFSLVLHGISEVGIRNLTDFSNDKLLQSYDSVTRRMNSALSNPILRRIFTESCDLFELLAVIKKFVLQRKVFTCGEVSGEPESTHGFKANLVLNGNAIVVSEVVPPSQLLVAGSTLLGSFCYAVDHIGFVCEISCNIITMHEFDHPVMLTILHAFARACGSEYFTLPQYALAMTVVKSLVMFSEKQAFPTDSTSLCPSMVENRSKLWLCSHNCLFSESALSMENLASLLLEKLWKHDYSPQDLLLSLTSDENLCDFTDILSLVEILASFMSWDWTFDHIICPICEYLESHHMEGFSAAIIVLLGQLGRLGVGASGYEDAGVKKLREQLSAFVCETNFLKLDLSVQFAFTTSLLGLTRIKFEEIVEGKVESPAAISQSISASFIRDWFFRLSREQQSLFRLHQAGNEAQS